MDVNVALPNRRKHVSYTMPLQNNCSPESLLDQCITFVVSHPDCVARINPESKKFQLKDGILLPSVICDKIIHVYQHLGYTLDDKFLNIFVNPMATPLRRIKLERYEISHDAFCMLLSHDLQELDVGNCRQLTGESLKYLSNKKRCLMSLSIRRCDQWSSYFTANKKINEENRQFIIPNLQKLVITQMDVSDRNYFPLLLQQFTKLLHLDLSGCKDLGDLSYLVELPYLTTLILHNALNVYNSAVTDNIQKLKSLKHLDISTSTWAVLRDIKILRSILRNLPNLCYLDISCGNFYVEGEYYLPAGEDNPVFQELKCREKNPFEFLGLYKTYPYVCERSNIPAKKISGDATEEQLLNAGWAFLDRPELLFIVFKDLGSLFKNKIITRNDEVLMVTLETLYRYPEHYELQLSGSGLLCNILRLDDVFRTLKNKTKQKIIRLTLDLMNAFEDRKAVIRNCCNILYQFDVPVDVMFERERVTNTLLRIIKKYDQQSDFLKKSMQIMNDMGYLVNVRHKQLLGDLGVISTMLWLIDRRLKREQCDEILDLAWSTMWNITDETPINSRRFIDEGGIKLFLRCLKIFEEDEALLVNVMGLMGNVAEVPELRPHLINTEIIEAVVRFLDCKTSDFEVTYDAIGILSNLCSEGAEAWTIKTPERAVVLKKMVSTLEKWNLLKDSRNMTYMTMKPLFNLLRVEHTPECRHWAVWAIANLITVNFEKYCNMLKTEGGIQLLENVMEKETEDPAVKKLAQLILDRC